MIPVISCIPIFREYRDWLFVVDFFLPTVGDGCTYPNDIMRMCFSTVFGESQKGREWDGQTPTFEEKKNSGTFNRGWWFQTFFYVHPYLATWSNLTNIFQMGWFNHQLVTDWELSTWLPAEYSRTLQILAKKNVKFPRRAASLKKSWPMMHNLRWCEKPTTRGGFV